jgi:hypothetical protein
MIRTGSKLLGVLRSRLGLVSARRVIGILIVAVCLASPIAEMFDQWDHTLQDGNDSEANLIIVALCIGVAFSVVGMSVRMIRAAWLGSQTSRAPSTASIVQSIRLMVPPTASPPIALRV